MRNRWWFVLAAFLLYYLHILNNRTLEMVIIGLVLLHVTHPDSIFQREIDQLRGHLTKWFADKPTAAN
jgi:hypothetical protein